MKYLDSGADISKDGKYRYRLWRRWGNSKKSCLFIMLNPSTADGSQDDPTIRRCVGFSKRLGYSRLDVVNLFAYRSVSIANMTQQSEPVGPDNKPRVLEATNGAGIIICAWGTSGGHLQQDKTVLGWLEKMDKFALGITAHGHPRHPLYLSSDSKLVLYRGAI